MVLAPNPNPNPEPSAGLPSGSFPRETADGEGEGEGEGKGKGKGHLFGNVEATQEFHAQMHTVLTPVTPQAVLEPGLRGDGHDGTQRA